MSRILQINSSLFSENGQSSQLAARFANALLEGEPDADLVVRDKLEQVYYQSSQSEESAQAASLKSNGLGAVHTGSSLGTMDSVKHEIEALHEFFVAWFTGRASVSRFDAEFLARFDSDFRLIDPQHGQSQCHSISACKRHGAGPVPRTDEMEPDGVHDVALYRG